jgi:cardiolipin synthase
MNGGILNIYRSKGADEMSENPEQERFKNLILYNLHEAEAVLTDNNDIQIFIDGKEKFKAMIKEMNHAHRYIHIQYYIIRNVELWH